MALLNTLIENFDTAGALNAAKWTFSNLGLNGSASNIAGKMVLNAGTTSAWNGECHVTSVNAYDMTNNSAYVKVGARSHPAQTWVAFMLETSADSGDNLAMWIDETGQMYCVGGQNGSGIWGTNFAYDMNVHAWWRIRHQGSTFYFDTAPASASNPPISTDWVNRFSTSVASLGWSPGSATSVKVHIYQRLVAAGAGSNPTAEFDGFNTLSGTTGGTAIAASMAAVESSTKDSFFANAGHGITAVMAATAGGNANIVKFGVNIHEAFNTTAENQALAVELNKRNIKRARMDYFYDVDQSWNRDFIIRHASFGGTTEMVLQISYQWDDTIYTGSGTLASIQADAYNQTYTAVNAMKDIVTDFEMLNEITHRPGPQSQLSPQSGYSASSYAGKTAFISFGAVLRGMCNAIHQVAIDSGRPLRAILGMTGRDFGFLQYMKNTEGVNWDVIGWHHYSEFGHTTITADNWFSEYGANGPMTEFQNRWPGVPITMNEFNHGEIYWSTYGDASGDADSESGYKSIGKHGKALYDQTTANLDYICFYEMFNEDWKLDTTIPIDYVAEAHFGLYYDPASSGGVSGSFANPKVSAYVVTALAGGTLSSGERTAVTSRSIFTGTEIDTFAANASAVSDTFAMNVYQNSGAQFHPVETGADVMVATAQTKVAATMAATEVGLDVALFIAGGTAFRTATLAATESGLDTFIGVTYIGNFLPPYQPPTTDAEFIAWLKTSDSAKCLLVEVDVLDTSGVQTTLYLSSVGYVTLPQDSPANTIYHSDVIGGCTVDAQIQLNYTTDITYGDVVISNVNGVHDDWLSLIWKNRPIRFFLGDVRWRRAAFRMVFNGVCQDLGSSERNKLNIILSDKLQRLNQSVSSHVLGGTTDNKEKLIPLCFGECSNITPLLVNPSLLEYQVHDGPVEDIVEVRDEGIPVTIAKDNSTGKFQLQATPVGRVTATVQGDKFAGVYSQTVSQIVKRLVTGFGTQPFNSGEIDLTNFNQFDINYSQKVSVYLENRENILDVINQLTASLASTLTESALGLLRLVRLEAFPTTTVLDVNESHMVASNFALQQRIEVEPSIKLAYCRNWTPQEDLQTGIPASHKDLWADQWMYRTLADTTQASRYNMPLEPKAETITYLISTFDADTECAHRLNLWGVPRSIYGFNAFPELLLTELGDWINVTHDRYSFNTGKDVFILGVEKDWLNCRVRFRILT